MQLSAYAHRPLTLMRLTHVYNSEGSELLHPCRAGWKASLFPQQLENHNIGGKRSKTTYCSLLKSPLTHYETSVVRDLHSKFMSLKKAGYSLLSQTQDDPYSTFARLRWFIHCALKNCTRKAPIIIRAAYQGSSFYYHFLLCHKSKN